MQPKEIKKIVLREKDPLLVAMLQNDKLFDYLKGLLDGGLLDECNFAELKKLLLEVDKRTLSIDAYPDTMLYDIQKGHWDIYTGSNLKDHKKEHKDSQNSNQQQRVISVELPEGLIARSPLLDVKNGTVAIDFGTKSTAAGIIDERSHKYLLRIGGGSYKREECSSDYENPTIMEFIDIKAFRDIYAQAASRPATSWDQICVSHAASNHLKEADSKNFYRFFYSLKQWARSTGNHINIKDTYQVIALKDFIQCGENDVNPIEIYAYYIGRYINNMYRGIYLNYLLSFPTKYKKEVRDKIRQSFENGLRKSIPALVLQQHSLSVTLQASEPAAYAISALKEYGFGSENLGDKNVCYGVFDFGGGTTDFDFGVWRLSKNPRKYDFDIVHFGAGGDQYLGGENLLELLAYEVFKDNKEVVRANNCSFLKPDNAQAFGGSESLISTSSEARHNTFKLVSILREFWENVDKFVKSSADTKGSTAKIDAKIDMKSYIKSGKVKTILIDNDAKPLTIEFAVDTEKLRAILKAEIARGVENFLHSFKAVANKMQGLDKLHIFLAGNSSRSPLVLECFNEMIQKQGESSGGKAAFEIFPPLGTPEARSKQEELGISISKNTDLSTAVTCKTGVVFGLLDSRGGGRIQVLSEIANDDEAKFEFYLGMEKFSKFKTLLGIDDMCVGRDKWHMIFEYADELSYDIYYTADARATTQELSTKEAKMTTLKLDKKYGENDVIKIKITDVNAFTYEVFSKQGKQLSSMKKTIHLTR